MRSWFTLTLSAAAALLPLASAQDIVYDSIHNATVITGTWSSGSKNVITGSGFANPANLSFTYPATSGVSYSFDDNGYYEIARYRFTSNATTPSCITGVLNWCHGTYQLLANGSIYMIPLGDGYQQVQDPCAATSNFFENFNYTELYLSWRIFTDPTDGYKLHLFEFDGTPVAPQFQISTTPNMLPTELLRSVTTGYTTTDGFVTEDRKRKVKRGIPEPEKRSAAMTMTGRLDSMTLAAGIGAASLVAALLATL